MPKLAQDEMLKAGCTHWKNM